MEPVRSIATIGSIVAICLSTALPALAEVKPFEFESGPGRGSIWCTAIDPKALGIPVIDPFIRALKGRRVEVGFFIQRPRESLYQSVQGNLSAYGLGEGGKTYVGYPVDGVLESGWYTTPPTLGFNVANPPSQIQAEVQGGVYRIGVGREAIGFTQNGNPGATAYCAMPQDLDQLDETEQESIKVLVGILRLLFSRGRSLAR
jgi:hypothetical protein